MKIAITGANSSVGLNLLGHLAALDDVQVVACVRSERAMATLPKAGNIETRTISFTDTDSLQGALEGCDTVIHLAGILIENRRTNYATANVAATAAVVDACIAASVRHFIFVSVVGADAEAGNAYFRSKGVAERLAMEAGLRASILRTPILLGRDTAGANAMLNSADNEQTKLLGGGEYIMQPLDIDDLSAAMINLCRQPAGEDRIYELVGPEALAYRELISRLARKMGHDIKIGSAPILLAKFMSGISSTLKGGGVTPTVIDVITQNEEVAHNDAADLGLTLTPLDQTMDKMLATRKSS